MTEKVCLLPGAGRGIGAAGLRLADLPEPSTPWEVILRRLVTRAFRHAAKPDRLLYMALYDMNRADQAKRAGYLARVKHAMEQF